MKKINLDGLDLRHELRGYSVNLRAGVYHWHTEILTLYLTTTILILHCNPTLD